jgi:hypothetical protein
MNFVFLILPKIMNHRRIELFDFRQAQHLLEILFYHAKDFDSKTVQEKLGLAWFWLFAGAMAKRAKQC